MKFYVFSLKIDYFQSWFHYKSDFPIYITETEEEIFEIKLLLSTKKDDIFHIIFQVNF